MRVLLLLCALFPVLIFGQVNLVPTRLPGTLIKDGRVQTLAETGGLNNVQASLADLDGDGDDELYLFDRNGDVHLAFQGAGDSWTYAPELVEDWPPVVAFALLRDFDADGVPDLFSHGDPQGRSSISVHEGFRQNDGRLRFELVRFTDKPADVLHYGDNGVDQIIYTAISDIPAIHDLDGDGDLDISSFENSGGYIDLYTNIGPRLGNASTYLRYELTTRCYGGVYETNLDGQVKLADTPGGCAQPFTGSGGVNNRSGFHPGSTLTPYDTNEDGDVDLLLGDVNTGFVTSLTNSPTSTGEAYFSSVSYDWPRPANRVDLENFPAVYPVRLTSPAVEEFLVTPSNPGGGENYNCVWHYRESSEVPGQIDLLGRDFLTREAFDHGSGAHLTWGDLDGDGIDDMLVGNDLFYVDANTEYAELAYYRSGSNNSYEEDEPAWLRSINDILRPSALALSPLLVDMDSDGDLDLLIGNNIGYVSYAENTAGAGAPATFAPLIVQWMGIDVGTRAAPAVADVTGDGVPDLVVGEQRGQLAFFPNRGTANSPQFDAQPVEEFYGDIEVRIPGFNLRVNPRPAFQVVDNQLLLYIGTGQGRMLIYDNLPAVAGGTASLRLEQELAIGIELHPSFGRDVNGVPIVGVGTSRGGVVFYRVDGLVDASEPGPQLQDWSLSPNPSTGHVSSRGLSLSTRIEVTSLLGRQQVLSAAELAQTLLAPGVYVLTPRDERGAQLGKAQRLVVF